ncbi:MAG: DUF2937 family protein, partial [Opitutales bacterium]
RGAQAGGMSPGRRLLGSLDTLIDRALCVAGAVLFSQAPEFFQQYLQRLGGHLDEARRQLAQFRQSAADAGLSLDQLIARTAASTDQAVAPLAHAMREAVARADTLQAAHDSLRDASVWSRPFVFLGHLDPGIARATWAVFRPAVPTTLEGLAYALAGMLVFLALYHLGLRRLFGPKVTGDSGGVALSTSPKR